MNNLIYFFSTENKEYKPNNNIKSFKDVLNDLKEILKDVL